MKWIVLLLLTSFASAAQPDFLIYRDNGRLHLVTPIPTDLGPIGFRSYTHLEPMSGFEGPGSSLTLGEGPEGFTLKLTFDKRERPGYLYWTLRQDIRGIVYVRAEDSYVKNSPIGYKIQCESLNAALEVPLIRDMLSAILCRAGANPRIPTLKEVRFALFGERGNYTEAEVLSARIEIEKVNDPDNRIRRKAAENLSLLETLEPGLAAYASRGMKLSPEQDDKIDRALAQFNIKGSTEFMLLLCQYFQ